MDQFGSQWINLVHNRSIYFIMDPFSSKWISSILIISILYKTDQCCPKCIFVDRIDDFFLGILNFSKITPKLRNCKNLFLYVSAHIRIKMMIPCSFLSSGWWLRTALISPPEPSP